MSSQDRMVDKLCNIHAATNGWKFGLGIEKRERNHGYQGYKRVYSFSLVPVDEFNRKSENKRWVFMSLMGSYEESRIARRTLLRFFLCKSSTHWNAQGVASGVLKVAICGRRRVPLLLVFSPADGRLNDQNE